ncbi:helix-turn-helix domain-containing protein [Ulvibacterium sp.]|uniref:helix-turn-helix domain-containing protein n=1 Tax=Ulvibacterium sp. TaxID=2665914 RepID=UPI003BAB927C
MGTLINFILWAALLQGLFLALVYIFSKRNRSFANVLLGLFLIAIVLEALTTILPFDSIGNYSLAEYFSLPEVKLFIPLLFLHFVLEKLGSSHKYKWFLKINYFIAFLIGSIVLLNFYLFVTKSSSIARTFDFPVVDKTHFILQSYAFVITVCAFLIAARQMGQYKALVQNEFSDQGMLQVRWLWRFIYMVLPAILLWGVELLRILIMPDEHNNLVLPIFGFVALFLYYLSYQAYRHPNLFEMFPESVLDNGSGQSPKAPNDLNCTETKSNTIKELMIENEYYLDHDLTLGTFAKEINVPPRVISTCINKNFGQNFNDWVNGFRVQRARKLLEEDVGKKLSVEGIGLEAGFKSRSAFYSAFKNKLGRTPGQFRKN